MKKIGLLLTLLAVFANAEFVRTEKGTVKDTVTNLEWQDSYKDKDGNEADTKKNNWYTAISYCHDLDLDGKGWRLPNINELKTLIVDTQYAPSISDKFKHTVNDNSYWSSTTFHNNDSRAFVISFSDGVLFWQQKNYYTSTNNIRCVRDGQ